MKETVLIVDDEPSLQVTLRDTLSDEGFNVGVAATAREAARFLKDCPVDLVISDLRLPDGSGIDVVRSTQRWAADVPVLILTAYATVDSAVEALKAGASEYLTKPFDEQSLLMVVRRHLEVRHLRRRVGELQGMPEVPVGRSPAFARVVELARAVARSESTVLIMGETGTGKDVLAHYIHSCSPRRNAPFIAVNCAALPESLLESELFGRVAGAYTGAREGGKGRFEAADGGTLFLDEIGELPHGVQAKLLRVLEERRFERLGSAKTIAVDVRIIAATRRDLARDVKAGRFRDDLFYRLNVVPIEIPPLRSREGDVALLLSALCERIGNEIGRRIEFSSEAVACLETYSFPGNVRQLENLIRRLAAVCSSDTIQPGHLPEEFRSCCPSIEFTEGSPELRGTLPELLKGFEKRILEQALERYEGHRGKMADALGISRKNLWEKLRRHGLGES